MDSAIKARTVRGLSWAAVLRLGWRNLWRNYRRTLIMLAAISVGVWAMIFMTAMLRGMVDKMVEEGIRDLPGQVQIHHPAYRDDPSIANSMPPPSAQLLAALNDPGVTGWSGRVRVPGVIASERDSRGVLIIGVDPAAELDAQFFQDEIVAGRFLESSDDKGVVIGKKLAEQLETRLGKRIVLMSQDPDNNVADRGFRVVGIYQARLELKETTRVYAGRDTLQKLLKMNGQLSEIAVVSGDDYRDVDGLQTAMAAAAGSELEVLPWSQLDPFLGSVLGTMDGIVLIWVVVIFLALSFGLVNTLMMAVFERIREIGLMMALGMRPASILKQILTESLLLLGLGLVIGNVAAAATLIPLASGIDVSIVGDGMAMIGAGTVLYPAFNWPDLLAANAVVIVLGLLTSLLPAWRASRLDPVRALTKT